MAGSGRDPKRPRRVGTHAEQAVAAHLAAAGLQILAVNLRLGALELDVVARDGPVIVVVEVRTRGPGAWVRALDSIDPKKQQRIRRAAQQLWLERFDRDPSVERIRFDVAAVELAPDGQPRIEIVTAAF